MKLPTFRTASLVALHFALFLQLPDGLLHPILGSAIYARDLALYATVAAVVFLCMVKSDRPVLLLMGLFVGAFVSAILPSLLQPDSLLSALIVYKWVLLWIISFLAAYYSALSFSKVCIGIIFGYLILEASVGIYEIRSQSYFLDPEVTASETAFGMNVFISQTLDEILRVKGLQRAVFSFANLMAAGVVLSLIFFARTSRWGIRATVALTAVFFTYCLINSGGRSALFGVFWSSTYCLLLVLHRRFAKHFAGMFIAIILLFNATVSVIGIGNLTTSITQYVFGDSAMGNVGSAFDRDETWEARRDTTLKSPLHWICGAPVASLFDPKIPAVEITDNHYIWLFYHTGVIGLCVFAALAIAFVRSRLVQSSWDDAQPFMLLFTFSLGEAVARETFFFPSAIFLFYSLGYLFARLKEKRKLAHGKATDSTPTPPPPGTPALEEV